LLRFVHDIMVGDIVITPDGRRHELLIGTVAGPYRSARITALAAYPHTREVAWRLRIPRDALPVHLKHTLRAPMAVFQPGAQEGLREWLSAVAP
jgi:predicted Mrr-cat superfamily restriction endonuclease